MKLSELSKPIGSKSTSRTDLSLAGLCPSLEYELGRSEQSLSESSTNTKSLIWTPQEGPQILAYYCLADILYYGAGAGGGKTDLLLGLALTAHKRSLILRRIATQLRELMDRSIEIVGTSDGFAEHEKLWRRIPGDRMLQFAGCEREADKANFQGRPHDLKGFDEITQFLRSQFEFIIAWTRSSIVGQRSRVVATGNPPFDEIGQWVIEYWGPWLNDRHPNPAAPAELRYYIVDAEGHEREVPTGDEIDNGKEIVRPKSRTFIPARVEDNIYYMRTGYKDTLASLPEPLRSMMREGKFNVARAEDPFQVIPSAWIKAAQARWTPKKPDIKLSAVGLDPSRGGKDKTVASKRYANWYAPLNKWPGSAVPDGPAVVALLIPILAVDGERARTAPVNCDVPGIGASAYDWGKAQGYNFQPYNGGSASKMRDKSGVLSFFNKRSADYWLLRELLDPANGEDIELPPDNELYADLAAARFRITPRGVQVEPKDCGKAVAAGASCCIKHRIGRSPDCGDAVVLATAECGTLAFFI